MANATVVTLLTVETLATVNNGKCQFNTKEVKAFRTILEKYESSRKNLFDSINENKDFMNDLSRRIDTNNSLIEKLEKGEKIVCKKTISDLQSEIEVWENERIAYIEENSKLTQKATERESDGYALITDNLYNAYKAFIVDIDNKDLKDAYYVAIANELLIANNVVPCMETIVAIANIVGQNRNSSTKAVKKDKLNGEYSKKAYSQLMLNGLCDSIVPINHTKFNYIPLKMREKSKKDSSK